MKKAALFFLFAMPFASPCALAQAVVSRGQAQLVDDPSCIVLGKTTRIPAGQTAKAGSHGVLLEFAEGTRVRLAPGSVVQLGPGVPINPVMAAPLEAPNATSAIKSILTRRDEQAFRNQAQSSVAHHLMILRSGGAIINERGKPTDIRVLNATLNAEDAYYSVTMIPPDQARLTVARGDVRVYSSQGSSQVVSCGEFAILMTNGDGGSVLAGAPCKITENELAMADQSALQLNQAGRLEPVAEMIDGSKELEPVGELLTTPFLTLPSVGTGPSVPFDLASSRILNEANIVNITGLVISPTTP